MGRYCNSNAQEPEANEHFTGWTVKVNGVEQDTDRKTDADDPTKVSFVMAENVEIKANFKGNPTLNIGDHATANIDDNDLRCRSDLTAIAPDGQHFTG